MALDFWLRMVEAGLRLRGIRRHSVELPGGQHVSYLEGGRKKPGPVFVFVHGLGSSNLAFIRALKPLARRHRVVALDLPGYGKSPLVEGHPGLTLPQLAEAVAAFLASSLFGGKVVLVGQSLGGWIGVKTARLRPDKVDQLVLVNSAGILFDGIEELRKALSPTTRDEVKAFWKRIWYRVPWYYKPFWRASAEHLQAPAVRTLLDDLREEHFINQDLPKLEVPVTIVWGRGDQLLPAHNVDALVQGLASTRVFWVAKCGHIPPLEQPRTFLRILEGVANAPPEARPAAPVQAQGRRLAVVGAAG